MGILDRFRSSTDSLKDKAGELASEHGDKIGDGFDKAGGVVNKATGGKFEDKIDKATGKAKEGVEKLGDQTDGTEGTEGGEGTDPTPGDGESPTP